MIGAFKLLDFSYLCIQIYKQMLADLLKRIFGDKSAKDRKEYQPLIDQTNVEYEKLKTITDDELRGRTTTLKM